MKYEPGKLLRNIDLTCFQHVYTPRTHENPQKIFLSGTPKAYSLLISFFENQLQMAEQFGTATKEIYLKSPDKFLEPLTLNALKLNEKKVELSFLQNLKIKLAVSLKQSEIVTDHNQLTLTITVDELKAALDQLDQRDNNSSKGFSLFKTPSHEILCVPLGDWLGQE
jgi:hypothetical protein